MDVRPVGRRTGLTSLSYSGVAGTGIRKAGGGAAQAYVRRRWVVRPKAFAGAAFLSRSAWAFAVTFAKTIRIDAQDGISA